MINKCNGFMGYIFGHKFKEYLIETNLPKSINIEGSSQFVDHAIKRYRSERYVVICKRCGLHKKDNE